MPEKATPETISEQARIIDPNAELAFRALTDEPRRATGEGLLAIYQRNDKDIAMREHTVRLKDGHVKVLYLSELMLGSTGADVELFEKLVEDVSEREQKDKPDVIVISGILQGDFKHLDKPQRKALVPELSRMDEQFAYGKMLIDKAKSTGVAVVYNMGDDDRKIAENYTIDIMTRMYNHAKGFDSSVDDITLINRARSNPNFVEHQRFQEQVVFPYMLRAGRRLRTASEMSALTDGAEVREEYFLLREGHQVLQNGGKLHPTLRRYLDLDALKESTLPVYDDFYLNLKTKGKETVVAIRHNMGFSDAPAYQDHMGVPIKAVTSAQANGKPYPDVLVIQHQAEQIFADVGVKVISNGSMQRGWEQLDHRGSMTSVAGHKTKRQSTTRRRIHDASTIEHQLFDDGTEEFTIWNRNLWEKGFSLPESIAIPMYCDWQTGSITAQPELQIKFMDYVRTRILEEMPVHLQTGGDIVHGRIYPNHPMENQGVGMMSMDTQTAFVKEMLENDLDNYTPEQAQSLMNILLEIGNHEWHNGTEKQHGYSFHQYIKDTFVGFFIRHGMKPEEARARVEFHDQTATENGDLFHSYDAHHYYGAYGMRVSHYLNERGSQKGGGGLPVYAADTAFTGAGDNNETIDISRNGHWHYPQHGIFGDKLAMVDGSLAKTSGYEYRRGYRPKVGASILILGGNTAPRIRYVGEETLQAHKIKDGVYSDKQLRDKGFKNDEGYIPGKTSTWAPDDGRFPKSGLQKYLSHRAQQLSRRESTTGIVKNSDKPRIKRPARD